MTPISKSNQAKRKEKVRISFWNNEVWFAAPMAGIYLVAGKHKTRFNWLVKLWLFFNGIPLNHETE